MDVHVFSYRVFFFIYIIVGLVKRDNVIYYLIILFFFKLKTLLARERRRLQAICFRRLFFLRVLFLDGLHMSFENDRFIVNDFFFHFSLLPLKN